MTYVKSLSPREIEVVTWTAKGKTYSEIAQILGLSFGTVHAHMNHLKLKLNAMNAAHAVALSYEIGIIEPATSPSLMERAA
jgi:LuxR family quorum sensing-dependent transcriptional regulator